MDKKIQLTEADEISTREKLIEASLNGKVLYYSGLRLEKDSLQMSHLKKVIEKISLYELGHNRPILCAIVVRKKDAKPSIGFRGFVGNVISIQTSSYIKKSVLSIREKIVKPTKI